MDRWLAVVEEIKPFDYGEIKQSSSAGLDYFNVQCLVCLATDVAGKALLYIEE